MMGRRTRAEPDTTNGTIRFTARLGPGGPPTVESGAARFNRQLSELIQRAWSSRPLLQSVELAGHADLEHGVMPPAVRDAADDGILAVLAALAGGAAESQAGERPGRFWMHATCIPLAPPAPADYTGPAQPELRDPPVPSPPLSPPSVELLDTLRRWLLALPEDAAARAGEMAAMLREAKAAALPEVERAMAGYLRTLRPATLEEKKRVAAWINGVVEACGGSLVVAGQDRPCRLDVYSYRAGSPGRFRLIPKGSTLAAVSTNDLASLVDHLRLSDRIPDPAHLPERSDPSPTPPRP